jgi:hypothetical protein
MAEICSAGLPSLMIRVVKQAEAAICADQERTNFRDAYARPQS